MNVDKIMSSSVVTISMDDSLKKVKDIFDRTHFHHLIVVEGRKLVGVISDRDLLEALSPNIGSITATEKDIATLNKKVHQIMSRNPVTLNSDANIYNAISIFNSSGISCIPIVDEHFHPIGIVSWRDIFRVLEKMRNK